MSDVQTNVIDFFISLVPLAQSVLWVGLIGGGVWAFRTPVRNALDRVVQRIGEGDDLESPIFTLTRKKALEELEKVVPPTAPKPEPTTLEEFSLGAPVIPRSEGEWITYRKQLYERQHRYYLAHIIRPSKAEGQDYDIYIIVRKHKSDSIDEIEKAEFFLGHYWDNEVFMRRPTKRGLLGFRTAAFGPFLCVCKVTLRDGTEFMLDRYVDFEMGKVDSTKDA